MIIGGGPAGSSAAFHLARAGWEAIVVEAKAFPRAKVCGEFISPAATGLLEAIAGLDALRDAGARRVGELMLDRGKRSIRWRMPSASGGAWVLSRRTLDGLLLDAARREGAEVMQPARVHRVRCLDDRVEVEVEVGVDRGGERVTLASDIVVHADGAGRSDGGRSTSMRRGVVGLKCHVRLPPARRTGALHMRACRGAYVGLVGVEDGSATLALVANKGLIARFAGDSDALLRSLWPAYDASWRESDWLASGVAESGYVEPSHPRSFRVGNAAASVEPVGGEGIGLALWSGRELSQALERHRGGLVGAQRDYRDAYRARLRWRKPACRLAAATLMRPRVVGALWPVLVAPVAGDVLLSSWYRLTGKPSAASPA